MKNLWMKRKAEGGRWRWRVTEAAGEALDDLGYEALMVSGVVKPDEFLRLFDLVYTLAIAVGRDFEALRTSGLGEIELMTEISTLIGTVKARRHWDEAVDDHYDGDKLAAEPERRRTAKILGAVGTKIVRMIQQEAA